MKTTHTILFGLVAASAWLIAGSVTIPHTFQANTTAKAAEVNANFSAVKTAVDGNANDIATNEADIATNKTDIAGAITDINATGGLTGGGSSGSVTVRRSDGHIAIAPATFAAVEDDKCILKRNSRYVYFKATVTTYNSCVAYAPVFLPDGATIKDLTCYFKNNDGSVGTNPEVEFHRRPYANTGGGILLTAHSGGDNSAIQSDTVSNIDPAKATVDNNGYNYILVYDPPNNTDAANTANTVSGNKQILFGCSVGYSFQ